MLSFLFLFQEPSAHLEVPPDDISRAYTVTFKVISILSQSSVAALGLNNH